MRMPRQPIDWTELRQKLLADKETIYRVLSVNRSPVLNDRYIHWDKMQYLDQPEGLSKEEWWATFKLARTDNLRDVPLSDKNGQNFQFMLPDSAIEYLHDIDKNSAGSIEMFDEDIANPATRDRYIVRSLVEEAITSSQLEGATSTRKVAKEMLRTKRAPRNKSERMILNNYITMSMIRDRLDQPLSKELVFELHAKLIAQTHDDPTVAGRFRREDEDIKVYENLSNNVVHNPPAANQLPARMKAMCDFANGKTPDFFVHPVVRAIILHFWLSYDHPFVDGNGRCARALFYWLMLKQGYWLSEYISISQIIKQAPAKYGRAFLYTETDDNDLTYFILYHFNVLHRAIDGLHTYIKKTTKQVAKTEELLSMYDKDLNHRQLTLLSHSLRHPDARYTIKGYQNTNRITYETARTDLLSLVDLRLIEKKKQGKTFIFLPIKQLGKRLRYA